MAKLTIELDPETHQQLKQLATKDERSLTQYIGRVLRQHAGTLTTDTTEIPSKSHRLNSETPAIKKEDNLW